MREELRKEAFLGGLARGAINAAGNKLTSQSTRQALQQGSQAVGSYLQRSAGNIGAGMGVGGAAGGLIGGAKGAYDAYHAPEEEGGGSVVNALLGGLGGAGKGALVGTAIGGAAGLASGGRGSETVAKLTAGKYNPLGLAARSGQRKLHSVTGLVPGGAKRGTEEYAKALTGLNVGGLGDAAKALERAENPRGGWLSKARPEVDQNQVQMARSAYDKAVGNAQAGQTSLVGIGQNLQEKGLKSGVKDMLQRGAVDQWNQSSMVGKALMMASPVAAVGTALMSGSNPDDPNAAGVGERVGGAVGRSVTGLAAPMLASTGSDILSGAGERAGGTIGKGIDKIVGAVRRPGSGALGRSAAGTAEPGISGPPVERVYTNAALGRPPEDLQT